MQNVRRAADLDRLTQDVKVSGVVPVDVTGWPLRKYHALIDLIRSAE